MCQCGSYKVYGTKKGETGHSSWCPWAPAPQRVVSDTCEGYIEPCPAKPEHWLRYHATGPKFFYCKPCADSIRGNSYTQPVDSGRV